MSTAPPALPTQDPATLAWTFPEGWAPAQRDALIAVNGELKHHEIARDTATAAGVAALASPDAMIKAARVRVDDAKRARERAERVAVGEVAWLDARALHGADVERLDTEEGDVLIVGHMNEKEIAHANERAQRLLDQRRARLKGDATEAEKLAAEAAGLADYKGAQQDELLKKVAVGGLDADASRARLKYLLDRYAGLFPRLCQIRDGLVIGFREAEGKGFAPV